MSKLLKAYRASGLYRLRHAYASSRILRAGLARVPVKLHLGCGPVVLPYWINIDARRYPGVAVMQLPAGLKRFPDNAASFVYCSHMVEHIEYPERVIQLATEIRRILKPGGALRFVVPGIERIIRAYVTDDKEFFKEQERHHPPSCTTKMEHLMYALQQGGEHKYGYDFETAQKFLQRSGFTRIVNSSYNASEFPELRVDYRGKDLSLFVDAVK
jgi:predicted SAM-dependent methyltransferase